MANGMIETDLADVRLKPLDAVAAEDEPDLEGAEATPKAEMPVSVVDHQT